MQVGSVAGNSTASCLGVIAVTVTMNGTEHPVIWTSVDEWSIDAVVDATRETFALQGLDEYGNPTAGSFATVLATVTGALDAAEDSIVIQEILYHPIVPGEASNAKSPNADIPSL